MRLALPPVLLLALNIFLVHADFQHNCSGERMILQCRKGQVLSIPYANWGNSERECGKLDETCDANVTQHIREICGSRSDKCEITVNKTLGSSCNVNSPYNGLGVYFSCENDSTQTVTICQNAIKEIVCTPPERIRIQSAFYGRSDSTTCPNGIGYKDRKCSSPTAFFTVSSLCNGRTSCLLASRNYLFNTPCRMILNYAQISWTCYN